MNDAERDREMLAYIAESISLIERYIGGGEAVFVRDPMVQDAVLRRLETLADATRHLSGELIPRHPEIPWRAIYGFRNVAAHGYVRLNMTRVWTTVQEDIPTLKTMVAEELSRQDRE